MTQVGGGPLVRCLLNSGQAVVLVRKQLVGADGLPESGLDTGKKPT
jgi:hypothetical protein